jgi:magnesium-transporting ATPase (P-type)
MHTYSTVKYGYFKGLISKLSYEGLRTIGYSCKEVSEKELQQYLKCDRERFLADSKLIGVVAFENKLKDDAVDTIRRLK